MTSSPATAFGCAFGCAFGFAVALGCGGKKEAAPEPPLPIGSLRFTVEPGTGNAVTLAVTMLDPAGKPTEINQRTEGAVRIYQDSPRAVLCSSPVIFGPTHDQPGPDGAPLFREEIRLEQCARPQGDSATHAELELYTQKIPIASAPISPAVRAQVVASASGDLPAPGPAEAPAAAAAVSAAELRTQLEAEAAELAKLVPLVEAIKPDSKPQPCGELPAVSRPPSVDHEVLRSLAGLPPSFPAEQRERTIDDHLADTIEFEWLNSAAVIELLRQRKPAGSAPAAEPDAADRQRIAAELASGQRLIKVYRAFRRVAPLLTELGKRVDGTEVQKAGFRGGGFAGVVLFVDRAAARVACWAAVEAQSTAELTSAKSFGESMQQTVDDDLEWNFREAAYRAETALAPQIVTDPELEAELKARKPR